MRVDGREEADDTAATLFERLHKVSEQYTWVLIQFTKPVNLFSTVVAALVNLEQRHREKGGGVVLCTDNDGCLMVIEMLGLKDLFQVYASVDGVLRDFPLWTISRTESMTYRIMD